MRAVRVGAFGAGPTVEEVPDATAAPGRTLVRVEAAAISHVDRAVWSGGFFRSPPLPYTPGVEAAGTVVDSAAWPLGARVWIRGGGLGTTTDGTWADLVSAPDASLGALPDGVPAAVGATFFSPCASAWLSLRALADLRPGERLLVTGAAGAVGGLAVQLGLRAGATVTGTVSRPERASAVPGGAEVAVVDGSGPVALEPADVVVDTVGGPVLSAVLPAVAEGGRVVLVGYLAGDRAEVDVRSLITRDVAVLPLNLVRREDQARAAAPELLAALGAGELRLDVRQFAPADAADALARLASPGRSGRAVLRFADGSAPGAGARPRPEEVRR